MLNKRYRTVSRREGPVVEEGPTLVLCSVAGLSLVTARVWHLLIDRVRPEVLVGVHVICPQLA
ncbi:hypothetical protein B0H34DRAFT_738383 [Crassisporium funariophilum]|nr:hypothetical protein B0H34DRAFT_738383 [Crassisporium funariophilum]